MQEISGICDADADFYAVSAKYADVNVGENIKVDYVVSASGVDAEKIKASYTLPTLISGDITKLNINVKNPNTPLLTLSKAD